MPAPRRLRALVVATPLLLATAAPAAAEWSLGLTGGAVWPLDQDVKLIDIGSDEKPRAITETRGASPSVGGAGGFTLTGWRDHFGLQLDGLYWTTSVDARQAGAAASRAVDEERGAVLLSLLGRLFLGEPGGPFVFLGVGGGAAVSRVSPGRTEVGPAVGALAGVAIPLGTRLRLRLEVRYLVTPDVDADSRPGVQAETSGAAGGNPAKALFGPHLDTQFVPVLVGLDWIF